MSDEKTDEGQEFVKSAIEAMIADEEFVKGIQPLVDFLKEQKTCHCCKKTDALDEMRLVDGFPTCKRCRIILSM